jgi:hypothetical protein
MQEDVGGNGLAIGHQHRNCILAVQALPRLGPVAVTNGQVLNAQHMGVRSAHAHSQGLHDMGITHPPIREHSLTNR